MHCSLFWVWALWYSEIICATACQCEMCQLLAERLTYPSFQTTLSCTDETSKVETGLSADWVYFAPFQTDTQVTVLLCWALSDLKTPILFLLSLRLNTALHYALLALLSLSTLVFRNNMCHCLSVWDVSIARWAVDISQFSNHSELHWWDLKGRNRTVCRLSLFRSISDWYSGNCSVMLSTLWFENAHIISVVS